MVLLKALEERSFFRYSLLGHMLIWPLIYVIFDFKSAAPLQAANKRVNGCESPTANLQ